ncbi:probable LRR receptor-like serine/threonine-protein kinase At3g47570 [Syzygium oleosum]|uniref:probable LRR receptor-like serine/threonine-protein kinase At3g47570 n=1 Tax=Syzygium oleosum TaxID=219896 RepID=UPI0024B8D18D|nr:probable LRR receptor-like serine/threonine-protein kinase At3g47570 [Syzygium oleosum]
MPNREQIRLMASLLLPPIVGALLLVPVILSTTVVDDLRNLWPPPEFNSTIAGNCLHNPSLRYCGDSRRLDGLNEIFKFTVVASHLCNESRNPNCIESFDKIDLRGRPKIAPLYLSFDFFWKYCPLTIRSIDFSNNSLRGEFPTSVLACAQIEALDFSRNELSGDFPVERLVSLVNLTVLNLSYNHFSECKLSESLVFRRFNSSNFVHSGLIPNKQSFAFKAMFLMIGLPVMVILIVGFIAMLCFRRRDLSSESRQPRHHFTTSMLKAATSGFSRENLEGKSDGVDIYRGILTDGTQVRIEIYWREISNESMKKFVEECEVLVQLHHKNLVRVFGWCDDWELRAVVTKWTDGESLEMWLTERAPPLKHRLKVLVGVMEGMCYLHELWPQVGYDLRTSSIILSENLEPLILRFEFDGQNSSSKNKRKFGVLLLEMITDRGKMGDLEAGEAGFIEYIRTNFPANCQNLLDERITIASATIEQARQVIEIGLACIDHSANKQLKMDWMRHILLRIYRACHVHGSPNQGRFSGDQDKRREHGL